MTEQSTQPLVSPDGYWRWDGHAWVPNHAYPTAPGWTHWGPPPAAQKSSSTKVIVGIVAGVVGLGIAFFFVLPMVIGIFFMGTVGDDLARGMLRSPTGPVADQLRSAGDAEAAYRDEHGVYTGSITGLESYGYEATDGIEVTIAWVRGTDYCLSGTDGTQTYFLGTALDTTPDPGTVSSFPCDRS